jgi:hypothetical protein
VIADLVGKHDRIRTVPMPGWCKASIDVWTTDMARKRLLSAFLCRQRRQGPIADGIGLAVLSPRVRFSTVVAKLLDDGSGIHPGAVFALQIELPGLEMKFPAVINERQCHGLRDHFGCASDALLA